MTSGRRRSRARRPATSRSRPRHSNASVPEGQTPTLAAARGIVKFTARAQNQRAGRITIGVLVTDGDPTPSICAENATIADEVDDVAAVLSQHYTATGIPTFVIGMNGATFDNVEKMAVGGSAPTHPDTVGTITDACGNGAGPCRHFNIATATTRRSPRRST